MVKPALSEKFLKIKFVLFSSIIPFFCGILLFSFMYFITSKLWRGLGLAAAALTVGLIMLFSVIYSFLYSYRFFNTRKYIFAYLILFPLSFNLSWAIYSFIEDSTLSLIISYLIYYYIIFLFFNIFPLILGYSIAKNKKIDYSIMGITNQIPRLICPFCQVEIKSQINYCTNCGKSLQNII